MKRLRELRLDANMTQEELAVTADLKQSTISRLENSGRRPHPKTLMKLAYALGVVPEKLDPDLADAYQPRPTRQMPEKVAKPLLVLVGALARKYARWNGERADLSSAGQEGLWEAWSKFEPDRGVPFEKFAGPRIKWRVLDKVRQLHRDPKNIQADDASSAPVLDWEKEERRLHIIDPFFAFFLRWGAPRLQDEMLRQRN